MDHFDILILRFDPAQEDRAEASLRRVFGADDVTVKQIVNHLPRVVRRGVDKERARRFAMALQAIGAEVKLRPSRGVTSESSMALLPIELPDPVRGPGASIRISTIQGPTEPTASRLSRPGVVDAFATTPSRQHLGYKPYHWGGSYMGPLPQDPGQAQDTQPALEAGKLNRKLLALGAAALLCICLALAISLSNRGQQQPDDPAEALIE